MIHEELKNCIGQYRELKKDLWWVNLWGVQKVDGYNFGVSYNDFAGHWQFSWNDSENEHKVADVEDIFGNFEDAKWAEEFGRLERTETLTLPTWEQITEEDFEEVFAGNDGEVYILKVDKEFDDITIYSVSGMGYYIRIDEATKENYTLACRKCKELFLGGE